MLRPEFEIEGCYLLPHEEARALLPDRPEGYRSQRDGRGPHAWQNHWLFVPLHDRRGRRIGYIWADDPLDRLRPDAERLQILRAFANQATTALEQASQFEEIQNAYEHHRALIDASPVAIVDFELDGRVRAWNTGATEIFGWTADEVIGRVSPIVPEDELEFFLGNLTHIAQGETIRDLDLRRLHRDGSEIEVSTSAGPIRDSHGEVVAVIASMVDVTARKRSERALAASEGRKDAVLRASLDCIVIVDHEGLVTEVNPATEETFGWTRPDAVGKPFLELAVAPEHRDDLAGVFANRHRPAARGAARDQRSPLRPPLVPRRGRDHPRRRARAAALRRLAARRDEAPRARGAAAGGGGEVPHARRADPARDVHQRRSACRCRRRT